MATGVRLFAERFSKYLNAFVVIGGTACNEIFAAADLEFRATKDIDLIILAEAVDADFIREFRSFIIDGGYQTRRSESGRTILYRFENPSVPGFPIRIEIFSRNLGDLDVVPGGKVSLRYPKDATSLSAIVMDDEYYSFVRGGTTVLSGLPVATAERLIPLKAKAWLDLSARKRAGESVDAGAIEKHRKDVVRLYAVLDPGIRLDLPPTIHADLLEFIEKAFIDWTADLKSFGLPGISLDAISSRLASVFNLDRKHIR